MLANGESKALLTDLYELTMLAAYLDSDMQDVPAVFEYFFRRLPQNTGFCVFAGLNPLLDDLENLHFTDSDLQYMRSLGIFKDRFIDWASSFRFQGDLYAPSEGSPVFPHETIVRVHAPLSQAQLIETLLLNRLNYQTLIATKAARCVTAANGDPIVEFGLRRAQGPDGGVSGARAAIIGGAAATSNVMTGKLFDVPVMGTHAHSWVMAFDHEIDAFRAYVRTFPEHPVLLLDTYDTLGSGLPNAITVLRELREQGHNVRAGVRLDSGDLAKLSKEVHQQLEAAGFHSPVIVASNELDEYLIADLKRQGAKINSWGVGTKLITGGNEPALGGIYKLSAVALHGDWRIKMKLSDNAEKTTDPGIKMPYRIFSKDGEMLGDVMFLEEEGAPLGQITSHDRVVFERKRVFGPDIVVEPLLHQVMQKGKRVYDADSLTFIRAFARTQISHLPQEVARLINPEYYWVGLSPLLSERKHQAMQEFWAGR